MILVTLAKMTENYYRVHHDFPVMVNGKRVKGPFNWNEIVGKWIGELPSELQPRRRLLHLPEMPQYQS